MLMYTSSMPWFVCMCFRAKTRIFAWKLPWAIVWYVCDLYMCKFMLQYLLCTDTTVPYGLLSLFIHYIIMIIMFLYEPLRHFFKHPFLYKNSWDVSFLNVDIFFLKDFDTWQFLCDLFYNRDVMTRWVKERHDFQLRRYHEKNSKKGLFFILK